MSQHVLRPLHIHIHHVIAAQAKPTLTPNPNHFRPPQHHRHCLTRSTPPQQSSIDMGSRMRKYAPSGEAVQVVPELVVEPLGPHLRHSGVVEAPEHLGVNLQLVVVVFKESLR
ncbi:hypothetical protein GUJ93_ZPchr0006g42750 [Zizania palustris]|uniref:Uncharacterized protein n=1 Tax=Zizania palustris TaxID=103762 RepID=A0A8J5VWL8_ZIZPA|nr:hypothetical protein GUJ93_ZPchr0006g42750 [Zizania palustris]